MTTQQACPVCADTSCTVGPGPTNTPEFRCRRCGWFTLLGLASYVLGHDFAERRLNRSLLSHDIRKTTSAGKLFAITEKVLDRYPGLAKLPDPQEQADNFILAIGDNQLSYDTPAEFEPAALAATVGTSLAPAGHSGPSQMESGLRWLLEQLRGDNLFEWLAPKNSLWVGYRLTMRGWERYNELRRRVVHSRRAFMAMKFGDPILDRMLATCFKAAVQRAGFELRALNEGQGAGLIDDQMRAAIRTARFLIADLTHDNNGAYFEAGFAEGLGLPVIYTCERSKFEKDKTHFDTNHMVTVPWQADAVEDAGRRLTATIRVTLPGEAALVDSN